MVISCSDFPTRHPGTLVGPIDWTDEWVLTLHFGPKFLCNFPVFAGFCEVPSGKQTKQWKIPILNRKYIFKWWIFHCYVRLPEGKVDVHHYQI